MDLSDRPASYTTWSTRQVIAWLRGLDDVIEPYLSELAARGVNGRWLNAITPEELAKLGVTKVGHQMIILDKIRQLQTQYAAFDNETLQTVLFRVSRSCACITAAVKSLMAIIERQDMREPDEDSVYPGILEDIQDAVVYVLSSVLSLMSAVINASFWLERPPFLLLPEMNVLRQFLMENALIANRKAQLAITTQSNGHFDEIISYVEAIRGRVEEVVQDCTDSLILTPCNLELVQIRKIDTAEFGFHFRSTVNSIHVIVSVQNESPAFCTGKVGRGDEVVEVNDQSVIGWQHRRVVELMRLYPRRISLRLKKRPTHTTDFTGFPGGGRRNRLVVPQNPTAGMLSQGRGGYLLTRTPKRRAPLTGPLLNEPLASTQESPSDHSFIPSPVSTAVPDVQTCMTLSPIYSHSSSSSSSSQFAPTNPNNSVTAATSSVKIPSYSQSECKSGVPDSSSAARMTSSTPSTPLMASRSLKTGDKNRENSSGSLSSSMEQSTERSKEVDQFTHTRSASSTPNRSFLNHFSLTHRRTASGGPTIQGVCTSNPDGNNAAHEDPDLSKSQALDSRQRTFLHRASLEDIVRLRKRVFGTRKASRRISCKDLGHGDCEGWLWLKKSNSFTSKYVKRWCVFKHSTLYYYRNLIDNCAEGLILLHGFTITPASEVKSGRFAFYVFNDWVRFVFASESERDRSKWMNVLGLAAIGLSSELQHSRIGGFHPGYLVSNDGRPADTHPLVQTLPRHTVPDSPKRSESSRPETAKRGVRVIGASSSVGRYGDIDISRTDSGNKQMLNVDIPGLDSYSKSVPMELSPLNSLEFPLTHQLPPSQRPSPSVTRTKMHHRIPVNGCPLPSSSVAAVCYSESEGDSDGNDDTSKLSEAEHSVEGAASDCCAQTGKQKDHSNSKRSGSFPSRTKKGASAARTRRGSQGRVAEDRQNPATVHASGFPLPAQSRHMRAAELLSGPKSQESATQAAR